MVVPVILLAGKPCRIHGRSLSKEDMRCQRPEQPAALRAASGGGVNCQLNPASSGCAIATRGEWLSSPELATTKTKLANRIRGRICTLPVSAFCCSSSPTGPRQYRRLRMHVSSRLHVGTLNASLFLRCVTRTASVQTTMLSVVHQRLSMRRRDGRLKAIPPGASQTSPSEPQYPEQEQHATVTAADSSNDPSNPTG